MYETFDHTADVGLRVRAASLDMLFSEAARGLFSLLVENIDDIRTTRQETMCLEGAALDYLLFDWLSELLFRFETEHLLFAQFTVSVTAKGLSAVARGESIDSSRHRLRHEIKAITYHQLDVRQTDDGWIAEVIVDI